MLARAWDFFPAVRRSPNLPETTSKFSNYAALPRRAARLFLSEPGSALLALRMGAWVVAVSLLMRLVPLPRAMRLVAPRRKGRRPSDALEVQTRLASLLDSVLAADFWVFTPTCWKRAPVLHRYLALGGIETRVLFGVRRGDAADPLSGHAWLEADGKPLLEKTPPDYKVTYSFPA